jgi:hypothetical protein
VIARLLGQLVEQLGPIGVAGVIGGALVAVGVVLP